MTDTTNLEMQQVQKHRDVLEQFTSQIEEIGKSAANDEVANMCRSIVHAGRFIVWLCDAHGIALFPENWKDITAETWEEAKNQGFSDGFTREEHIQAVGEAVARAYPNCRISNIHIHYIGGTA